MRSCGTISQAEPFQARQRPSLSTKALVGRQSALLQQLVPGLSGGV